MFIARHEQYCQVTPEGCNDEGRTVFERRTKSHANYRSEHYAPLGLKGFLDVIAINITPLRGGARSDLPCYEHCVPTGRTPFNLIPVGDDVRRLHFSQSPYVVPYNFVMLPKQKPLKLASEM